MFLIYLPHHKHTADKYLIATIIDFRGCTSSSGHRLNLSLLIKGTLRIQQRAEIRCFIQIKHPSPLWPLSLPHPSYFVPWLQNDHKYFWISPSDLLLDAHKIIIPENNLPVIKDLLQLKIFKAGIIPNNGLGNMHQRRQKLLALCRKQTSKDKIASDTEALDVVFFFFFLLFALCHFARLFVHLCIIPANRTNSSIEDILWSLPGTAPTLVCPPSRSC